MGFHPPLGTILRLHKRGTAKHRYESSTGKARVMRHTCSCRSSASSCEARPCSNVEAMRPRFSASCSASSLSTYIGIAGAVALKGKLTGPAYQSLPLEAY